MSQSKNAGKQATKRHQYTFVRVNERMIESMNERTNLPTALGNTNMFTPLVFSRVCPQAHYLVFMASLIRSQARKAALIRLPGKPKAVIQLGMFNQTNLLTRNPKPDEN